LAIPSYVNDQSLWSKYGIRATSLGRLDFFRISVRRFLKELDEASFICLYMPAYSGYARLWQPRSGDGRFSGSQLNRWIIFRCGGVDVIISAAVKPEPTMSTGPEEEDREAIDSSELGGAKLVEKTPDPSTRLRQQRLCEKM